MLLKRVISSVFGIIFFIIFIYWGTLPFALLIGLLTILAIQEYGRFLPVDNNNSSIFFSIFFILFSYLTSIGAISTPAGLFPVSLLILFLFTHLILSDLTGFISKLGFNLLGLIYIAGGFSFFIILHNYNSGPFAGSKALWLVLIATWANDIGAYFTGRFLGSRKLAPVISPNKTIEGAFGGVLFCILAITVYTIALGAFRWYWIIYAILAGVFAISGDLFESGLKRDSGVKDSGNLIPGHGGVLDRFDSLLFTAPLTYYFLLLTFGN